VEALFDRELDASKSLLFSLLTIKARVLKLLHDYWLSCSASVSELLVK